MQAISNFVLNLFNNNSVLCVICFALIPVIEIRGAIPLGVSLGLSIEKSAMFALLGSVISCLTLLYLFPLIIKLLEKTKCYFKFESVVLPKIEKLNSKRFNIYHALLFFVSVPLPLTGVTTACIMSCVLHLNKAKSFLYIFLGNIIASIIVCLTTIFLGKYSVILTIIFVVAFFVVFLFYLFKVVK